MNRTAVISNPSGLDLYKIEMLPTDWSQEIRGLDVSKPKDYDELLPSYGTGTSTIDRWNNYISTVTIFGQRDLTRSARDKIRSIPDKELAGTALRILSMINDQLMKLGNISHYPEFHSFLLEDGSIGIEWIFPNLRLGFGVDQNPEESSWFLVTSEVGGNISACGKLFCEKVHPPIEWLIGFVATNPDITI